MSGQLALPVVSDAEAWAEILDCARDIVRARGNKDVSHALDCSGSELSNMTADGRARTDFKLRHLPPLLRISHNDDLLHAIVKIKGAVIAPARPLTAAERLERLEAALTRAGAAGAAIRDDAYGRGR